MVCQFSPDSSVVATEGSGEDDYLRGDDPPETFALQLIAKECPDQRNRSVANAIRAVTAI